MGQTEGVRRRPGRALAIAASVLAPAALYLVARAAAVSFTPAAATMLPPVDYSEMLQPAVRASAHPRFRPDPRLRPLWRDAAVSSPTWHGAFLLEAKAAERAGRSAEAIRLLEEARRRRPSYLPTRLQLITHYANAGRIDDVIREMDYGLRYSDRTRRLILPQLAKLIADPAGRTAIASMLAKNPTWKKDFFEMAGAETLAPADVLALVRLRERQGGDLSGERTLYVQSLVRAGQAQRARQIWLQMLPERERQRNAFISNSNFGGRAALPPFDWRPQDGPGGRAEIVTSKRDPSYLDVSFFGSRVADLADQQLALAPGRYRLSSTLRTDADGRSGTVSWFIFCTPGGPQIARLPLQARGGAQGRVRTSFVVPAGCSGQLLRLTGEPGEITVPINTQIYSVEVAREN